MPDKHSDGDFLTIADAAAYVGVSPKTLRRWEVAGTLVPVRHPKSGYRHYRRADLEAFRLEYRRAAMSANATRHLFQTAVANIEGNDRLRDPQQDAHRKVREHFATKRTPAILQIPVGCGKTGIIATLPFGVAAGRVLVITPNLTIRRGVTEALDINNTKCFWAKTRCLTNFQEGPWVAVLEGDNANIHDCTESHFVITNIQQLASSADRWLPQFPEDFFDMILVDEGHHAAAASWQKVFARFPNAKVVSLTATPFRSDEAALEGELIYRYPFTRAMVKGYIKEVHSVNVAPSELYFTYHGDTRRHTLAEVLSLREEAWFRRGVALSPECNLHIAEASIKCLQQMRERTGTRHQLIAAACSVDHAKQVRSLYEQCGLRAKEIHSDMHTEEQQKVLDDLRDNRLDCIVQVQMLGEGFDHPRLSVGAIFRPFRSLAPYIQFVGRVMRVLHDSAPGNPDNHAFIVSHVGLNNEQQWTEFQQLDGADQQMIEEWLHGDGVAGNRDAGNGPNGHARRFDSPMRVDDEIISHFINQSYLNPEDDKVLDELLSRPIGGGLKVSDLMNRETLRATLRKKQAEMVQTPSPIPLSPQRRRQTTRDRLNERTKAVANRLLDDLALARGGREVGTAAPSVRGKVNHIAVTMLMHSAVNAALGVKSGQRSEPSAAKLQEVFDQLDSIGDRVRQAIKKGMR